MKNYISIVRANKLYVMGNVMEWYDFSLFGFFAIMIKDTFFSSYTKDSALIATFLIFAIGIAARPLGAILFGFIGDRSGHQRALSLAIQWIAWPTCLMGLLPGYADWGVVSTLGLIMLRLVQGVSVGGQYGGSIVLLAEKNPGCRAQACSLAHISSMLGYLIAIGVGELSLTLVPEKWQAGYAWRIPFILSLLFWWLQRKYYVKKPAVEKIKKKNPLRILFVNYWKPFLVTTILSYVGGLLYLSIFTFSPTFMQKIAHESLRKSLFFSGISLFLSCLSLPFLSWLVDRFGLRKILMIACMSLLVSAPLFGLLMQQSLWVWMLLGIIGLVLLNTLFIAAAVPLYSLLIPNSVRYTGCSLAYNVGMILAAPTPAVLTWLLNNGQSWVYGIYIAVASLLGLLISLFIRSDLSGTPCR